MNPGILQLDISDMNSLAGAAQAVLAHAPTAKIFLFDAPMGAGKTTFIKELCRQLGSNDHFSSPTYALVNEYLYPGGKIFHFDLYRLKQEEELLDMGIEEHLNSDNYCFFEWPELVENFLETDYLKIRIKVSEAARILEAEYVQNPLF